LAGLFGAACGQDDPAATPTGRAVAPLVASDGDTGVQGVVSIGPVCPVQHIDTPCPDKGFQTEVIALRAAGGEAGRTRTDADGRFVLPLPPGDYELTEDIATTLPRPTRVPVHVTAGTWTAVQITLDSGIR
jgi:hypothetical protein